MNSRSKDLLPVATFFAVVNAVCLFPVWWAERFINQDGSAHVLSAYLLLHPDAITMLNTPAVPNSFGHWLMTFLLTIVPAFTVTKLIVTLTFSGVVAAAGWIRYRTAGFDGVKTAILIGAVIAFNWLWLVGFYNFLIGAVIVGFAVGVVSRWDDAPGAIRIGLLAALFLAAYFSHIVSFGLVGGAVFVLLVANQQASRIRAAAAVVIAALPVIPLGLIYRAAGTGGGGMAPVWRHLSDVLSPAAWLAQLRAADPLILISRRSFPFFDGQSTWFVLFTPIAWLIAALLLLIAASYGARAVDIRRRGAFAILFAGTMLVALFAPDDFGLTNGSVLRERLFLVAMLFFIPLFKTGGNPFLTRAAQILLVVILAFQTAALADFARHSESVGRSVAFAADALPPGARIAAIVAQPNDSRFHAIPESMADSYLGIGTSITVWDNYELGHRLFPVVAKDEVDRRFVFELTQVNVITKTDPNRETRLGRLSDALDSSDGRISHLIVFGSDPAVDAIVGRDFEFQTGDERLRIFRRR